jgi:NAD(P)-dependent dehydrogenase (short-subunit alcohol dehydrogenase family)
MAGKIVVITGVARGLGLAMTKAFVEHGHTVVACARQAADVKSLRDRWPAPHRFDPVDVARDADVRRWAESALDEFGPPDLLINNAAVVNETAVLWHVAPDDFNRLIDVNIKGVANVIRHFAPAMVKRKRGVIVNFSSGWGRSTSPEVAPYCASKWAIEGLTQAMAQELPDGMAAVPLNPVIINTDMLQSCFGDAAASYPEPDDWAKNAVPYLLSLGPSDNGKPRTVPGSRVE